MARETSVNQAGGRCRYRFRRRDVGRAHRISGKTEAALERIADVGAGFVLGDGECGDAAEDLEGVDGIDVIVAVDVAEEVGRFACWLRSW